MGSYRIHHDFSHRMHPSLDGLTEVDTRMKRLAANKNLTDEEKNTRKAIATLLKSVDTNPTIAQARSAVDSMRQGGGGTIANRCSRSP